MITTDGSVQVGLHGIPRRFGIATFDGADDRQMLLQRGDERLNLIGRPEYKEIADHLRAELEKRIVAAGEPAATIAPIHYYA